MAHPVNWTCDFCLHYEAIAAYVGICGAIRHPCNRVNAAEPVCPLFVNRYDVMKPQPRLDPAAHELSQPTPADPPAACSITLRGAQRPLLN